MSITILYHAVKNLYICLNIGKRKNHSSPHPEEEPETSSELVSTISLSFVNKIDVGTVAENGAILKETDLPSPATI